MVNLPPMKKVLILVASLFAVAAVGQNPQSIDSLRKLLPQASKSDRIKVLLGLCWEYRFSNADTARQYGLKALQLARAAGIDTLEAEALNFIGITHEAQGNYNEALEYELPALALLRKIGKDEKTANTLNNIGIVYDEKGDYKRSLEYYFEARRIFERIHEPAKIAMVLSNIGIVLKAQKEYKQVVGYYHEALRIYKNLNNRFGIAACDANLGSVYFQLASYDSAIYYSLRATREFEDQGNTQFLAMTLGNAGMAFDKIGDEKNADVYLLKAQKLNEQYDSKKELAAVLIFRAGIHRRNRDLAEGTALARRGLGIAEKIEARSEMIDAHKELSDLRLAAGDFKGAYEERLIYEAIKDSTFQQEKSRQMAELQTLYETENKENAISLLTEQNRVKDLQLVQNQFFTIALIVLIFALIAFGFLWKNRVKLKQRAEIEMAKAAMKADQLQAVIASQEDERRRFAADLHDGMGQMISALRLNLSNNPVPVKKVEEAVDILNEMNVEIRKIAFNLMPHVLMNSGLTDALLEFAGRINRTGSIHVTVQAFDITGGMPEQQKIALYRICQEWINNVLKYAHATKIALQLVQHAHELVITIEDDGEGFDTNALFHGQGNGWKNINSRLGVIRGNIDIDSMPGRQGTTVVITVSHESIIMAA